MLSDSIKKVNSIVESTRSKVDRLVETGRDKIAMGQSTAEKCREALNKVTENAGAMAAMITEIAHASKEQSQGVQEINKAISQLDQVTQQNSAVAQQSSAQAGQLSDEASVLTGAVAGLVAFVDGNARDLDDSERAVKPSHSAKVTSIASRRATHSAPKSESKKMAAGGDIPSSSDPNFEEF